MSEEHEELVMLAMELREMLFDDASDIMQSAMVGSPVECVAFAKLWIKRANGMQLEPYYDRLFRDSKTAAIKIFSA